MRINPPIQNRAFTLIELILVMAVLIVIVALVTPTMSHFFSGRKLDSEARRFLALTRYGQSRAVSEGIPTVLWIDPKAGTYGLLQESGYPDGDAKAQDFAVADGLSIGIDASQVGSKALASGKRMGIRFSPDGSVLADTSVKAIFIRQIGDGQVWIIQTPDRLSYEIKG